MPADNPFRYVGEKLLEPAGPDLWPLAVLYFDPKTRGLKVALASVGAELVKGHGRKIGVIIEQQARNLLRLNEGKVKPSGDQPTDSRSDSQSGDEPRGPAGAEPAR